MFFDWCYKCYGLDEVNWEVGFCLDMLEVVFDEFEVVVLGLLEESEFYWWIMFNDLDEMMFLFDLKFEMN